MLAVLGVPALYLLAAFGLAWIPVNRGFVEAPEGIDIYLVSNGIHVDFCLPAKTPVMDWARKVPRSDFRGAGDRWTHLLLGWGDRGFYLETPTWADLKATTALKAIFWPSDSVVHAQYLPGPPAEDTGRVVAVRIGEGAFRELCAFLEESFQRDPAGAVRLISGKGYGDTDNFYAGAGSYHAFNTCNLWTSRGLKRIGVRTALWSPFAAGVLRHLPERGG